jgi:hypothetical protein
MRRLALLLLLAVLPGCDLFKPATPESPTSNVLLTNFMDPDSVLATLRRAIVAKGQANSTAAYALAFADSVRQDQSLLDGIEFRAFVSAEIRQRFPADFVVTENWTSDREQLFYSQLIRVSNAPYVMRWTRDDAHPDEQPAEDRVILHRKYLVQTATADSFAVAQGIADLYFFLLPSGSTRWVIYRWDDRVNPDAPLASQTYGERRLRGQ